jgi:hypothetical protein
VKYDTGWFVALAERLDGRVTGREHTGLFFVAACPTCGDGRVLAWTYRPSRGGPGFECDSCGRKGHIGWLRLLVRMRDMGMAA